MFRVLFGFMMLVSIIRFWYNGWIFDQYILPDFYFTYYGFEWVQPLGAANMYRIFGLMGFCALAMMFGFFYRITSVFFFLTFTYVELIDKTNYLNHYYFVSLISFLLIFLPALFNYKWSATLFSWCGAIYDLTIPFLLLNKYTRPLAYLAVIGFHIMTAMLFQIGMFPYIMILSTLIFFPASFHQKIINFISKLLVKIFNPISLFARLWQKMEQQAINNRTNVKEMHDAFPPLEGEKVGAARYFKSPDLQSISPSSSDDLPNQPNLVPHAYKDKFGGYKTIGKYALITYICFQLIFPFRYLLYPGNLYWTEQGYRFSWRVMLMEKAGYIVFHIYDPETGKIEQVNNYKYLTKTQEKQMSTQPDMILQFAHFLKEKYREKGFINPQIMAESYVTLNGRRSKPFIDSKVNLVEIEEGWGHKTWVLPLVE